MFSFFDVRVASWWGDRGEDSALLLRLTRGRSRKVGRVAVILRWEIKPKEAMQRLHCSLLYLEYRVLLIRGV